MKDQSGMLNGVYAAVLTPQNRDRSIDDAKYAEHCLWLLQNGCDGLAVMGTTGEANSFSLPERMAAVEGLVRSGVPSDRFMVGTGCCATPDSTELTRHALDLGAGGVLMLPPFYYKQVDDNGIFDSIAGVVDAIGDDRLRIYLYHFPKMAGVGFSDSVVAKLIDRYPGIIAGMKDSSGDWEHMKRLSVNHPRFAVFAGNERYLLDILNVGGAGCISAGTNISCQQAQSVFSEWKTEQAAQAAIAQEKLTSIRMALEKFPFVAGLKQLFAAKTNDDSWLFMRPPNTRLGREDARAIVQQYESAASAENHAN